eukprot:182796-Alexandrium_andersonii.AAC.1
MLDREAPRRPCEAERARAVRGGVAGASFLSPLLAAVEPTARSPEKFALENDEELALLGEGDSARPYSDRAL